MLHLILAIAPVFVAGLIMLWVEGSGKAWLYRLRLFLSYLTQRGQLNYGRLELERRKYQAGVFDVEGT